MAIPSLKTVVIGLIDELETLTRRLLGVTVVVPPERNYNSALVVIGARNRYAPLDAAGRRVQVAARRKHLELARTTEVVFEELPDTIRTKIREALESILKLINQDEGTHQEDVYAATAKFGERLTQIRKAVEDYLVAGSDQLIVVPDTNALYSNPQIEHWRFDGFKEVCLCIVPAVVTEIDRHKDDKRFKSRQRKAEVLVRQLGEYRRRGNGRLIDGVTIRKGAVSLMLWPHEPDVLSLTPFFDPDRPDHVILATTLEVARRNPISPVALVTLDVNLQTTAELARVPFTWPPEPIANVVDKSEQVAGGKRKN